MHKITVIMIVYFKQNMDSKMWFCKKGVGEKLVETSLKGKTYFLNFKTLYFLFSANTMSPSGKYFLERHQAFMVTKNDVFCWNNTEKIEKYVKLFCCNLCKMVKKVFCCTPFMTKKVWKKYSRILWQLKFCGLQPKVLENKVCVCSRYCEDTKNPIIL